MPADYSTWRCFEIQTKLNDSCATRAAQKSNTGFLDFILSEMNTSPSLFEYEQDPNGKFRDIRIKFHKRPLLSEFADTSQICNDTPDNINDVTLDSFLIQPEFESVHTFEIDGDEMRILCETRESFILDYIFSAFTVAKQKLNQNLLTKLATETGLGYGGFDSNANPVDLFIAADNEINFNDYQLVLEETEAIGCTTTPALIGNSRDLKALAHATKVGCCNDKGVDLAQMNGEFMYWNDRQFEGILGANTIGSFNPGAIQMVPYLKNVGNNEISDGASERTTITDPISGITYDITIAYDVKCHKWQIELSLEYALVFIDSDQYKATDPLFNNKGWLLWTTTP